MPASPAARNISLVLISIFPPVHSSSSSFLLLLFFFLFFFLSFFSSLIIFDCVSLGWRSFPSRIVVLRTQKLRSPLLRNNRWQNNVLAPAFKASSRSECSQVFFAHGQEFLHCPNFDLPGPFIYTFQILFLLSKVSPFGLAVRR